MGRSRATLRKRRPSFHHFQMSKHFIQRYRQRINSNVTEEEIRHKVMARLRRSKLIAVKGALEYRMHNGDIFVLDRKEKILITVFWSQVKHCANMKMWIGVQARQVAKEKSEINGY